MPDTWAGRVGVGFMIIAGEGMKGWKGRKVGKVGKVKSQRFIYIVEIFRTVKFWSPVGTTDLVATDFNPLEEIVQPKVKGKMVECRTVKVKIYRSNFEQ